MSRESAKFALDRAERLYGEKIEAQIGDYLSLAPLIRSARLVLLERGDFKTPKADLDQARSAYQRGDFDSAETSANRVYQFFQKDAPPAASTAIQTTQPAQPPSPPRPVNISGNPQVNVPIPPVDFSGLGSMAVIALILFVISQRKKG